MSKSKNKGSKKEKPSSDLLDSATVGLKKFRRFAKQVKKLSTTQKIVGSLALLAAGYALITKSSPDEASTEAPASEEPAPNTTPTPSSPAKVHKPRRTKPASPAQHVPFSKERP